MTQAKPKTIKSIYTDGACSGNPGPGGWGTVVYFDNGKIHEMGGAARDTTNNRMELQAAIAALEYLVDREQPEALTLYTDSEYVKNGITKWIQGWKQKGWKTAAGKPVLNQDLWQQLDRLHEQVKRVAPKLKWQYVKGHAGVEGNERCDQIARAFSSGRFPDLKTVSYATDKNSTNGQNIVNGNKYLSNSSSSSPSNLLIDSSPASLQLSLQPSPPESDSTESDGLTSDGLESDYPLTTSDNPPLTSKVQPQAQSGARSKAHPQDKFKVKPTVQPSSESIVADIDSKVIDSEPIDSEPVAFPDEFPRAPMPDTLNSTSNGTHVLAPEVRVSHLRSVLDTLKIADEIANSAYLITSSELADLMDVHPSAVTSRGDRWVWRNWTVSRVRREGNQILWLLERGEG